MTLDLGPISFETFLARHWRRRPLHVPGGARRVLETTVEPAQFLAACERLERLAPHLVYRRGLELAFAQRIDLADGVADGALHRVCERFAGWTAGAQIWFDGVYAREGMGIGSHFDLADTFLLQQRGTKLWRLHPPSFLPDEPIRQRLLNETIAAMYMPDGALEVRLDEGDLLYLPLLWVHWGISEGESLSLSLTLTARLGLECIELGGLDVPRLAAGDDGAAARARASLWCAGYPQPTPTQVPAGRPLPASVRETVIRDPRWWRPIPMVWTLDGEAAAAAASRAAAERHVEALAATLPELARAWAAEAVASVAASGPAPAVRPAPLSELEALLREAAALPDPKVDPARLVEPDWNGPEIELLRQRVARRCTGRFLRIVERSHEWIRNEEPRAALSTLVRALARMSPAQRARALSHTALRGWSWRAAEAIQFAYVPRLEAIVAELPRLLLPSLLEADALAPDDRLPVPTGSPAKRRLEALAPAWPGGPPILGDDDWIHGFFPAPERARGLALRRGAGVEERAALAAALTAGRAWLADRWPAWAAPVDRAFELVVLAEDAADEMVAVTLPPPRTTRAFPGLLAAAPRAPEATARMLVAEAARRLAHDALDGLSLVEDTPRESFAAWAGRGASLSERVADLLVHALVLEVLPGAPGAPGAPAAPGGPGPGAAAAAALRAEPGLTAAGAALIDGIARRIIDRADRG
jgi:hypothetical protein